MLPFTSNSRLGRGLLLAAVVAGASAFALPALAGECPADQKQENAREPVDLKPVGVTDTVIAMIDVANEPAKIKDRNFACASSPSSQAESCPGNSHGDGRPSSTSSVARSTNTRRTARCPLVHKAGATSWPKHMKFRIGGKNLGNETVVLLSADLIKDVNDHTM